VSIVWIKNSNPVRLSSEHGTRSADLVAVSPEEGGTCCGNGAKKQFQVIESGFAM
jgi:hypothetical protein